MSNNTNEKISNIESLRFEILEKCTGLFQHLFLTKNISKQVQRLTQIEHEKFSDYIKRLKQLNKENNPVLKNLNMEYKNSSQSLGLLINNLKVHSNQSTRNARDLFDYFNLTSEQLLSTTIERDLLDRQSEVLGNIILSHEHISQWKDFVQEILKDFYKIFPFPFFFIIFTEKNSINLYIYFMGNFSFSIKENVRRKLVNKVLSNLNLTTDSLIEIEEFVVMNEDIDVTVEDVDLLIANVPKHAPNLAGVLGVAYATNNKLSNKEEAIIQSILSVLVMLVGSSKVLNNTLDELEYYAVHDPLTGLYNRRQFNDMLDYEIGRAGRHHHEFSCIFIDCDDFKKINDSFGHPVGDNVLIEYGSIMKKVIRTGDVASRFGGDEFALLLPETGRKGAFTAAEHLREKISNRTFTSEEGEHFKSTISLGIVTFPHDGKTVDELMSYCDMALYKAKDYGKNTCQAYDGKKSKDKIKSERRQFELLSNAIQNNKIVPFFQPIYDCSKNDIFSYEVVARMIGDDGVPIPAGKFIDAIEKGGLARELDRSIIDSTFEVMKDHVSKGYQLKPIFINFSAQEIENRGILDYAIDKAQEKQIPPDFVVFELTEREAISDMHAMRKFLDKLSHLGFKFALDDFGSGYNSFHYLRELKFDYVKIDGEFVRNIKNSMIDSHLVKNLSNLCKDLQIKTIAEFIEDDEAYQKIKEFDVNFGQGFHLGMPAPSILNLEKNQHNPKLNVLET